MLKDLVSAVQKSLSDRVRDPLLGSFVGFFTVWNWKPLVILLFGSEMPFEARVETVHCSYGFPKYDFIQSSCPYLFWPNNGWTFIDGALRTYGIPALMTVAYLFAYPWLKKIVVVHVQKGETAIINARREHEKSIALTPEESHRLQSNLDSLTATVQKTARERYDLPILKSKAKESIARKHSASEYDFVIGYGLIAESEAIRIGHWMVLDPGNEQIFFFRGIWDKAWRPCLVVDILDGLMYIVRVQGWIKWSTDDNPWKYPLTGDRSYALAEKERGAITVVGPASKAKPNSGIPGMIGKTDKKGVLLQIGFDRPHPDMPSFPED